MDPNTGRIIQRLVGMSDEEWYRLCTERGLVQVNANDVPALKKMNRHQRRAWVSKQRRAWASKQRRVVP